MLIYVISNSTIEQPQVKFPRHYSNRHVFFAPFDLRRFCLNFSGFDIDRWGPQIGKDVIVSTEKYLDT